MQGKTGLEGLAMEHQVQLSFVPGAGVMEPDNMQYGRKRFEIYAYPKWRFIVQGSKNNDLFIVTKDFPPCLIVQGCFGLASSSFTALLCQMDGTTTMSFQRLLRLQSGVKGCFCCCLGQEMTIEAPIGREIASISEDWTILGTSLTIYDVKGKPVLKVVGPILPSYWYGIFSTEVFQVKTMAGTVVGEIRSSGKVISVSFPINLDVHIKGCLIGCAILVAFMFDFRGFAYNTIQVLRMYASGR
ncbi:phospholipid scramblase 1-like [Ornithodoros turicata]|uniref:phospholipid scramblase 1-like n=1 Tax=Ornithodoros turicata TaxID=34597 RepID=UPI003138B553